MGDGWCDAVVGCRLIEDTFTLDEVTDMLDGLLAVVRGDVETELINTAHTNVLLLRQLCQQAEKWHLKLHADLSELENRWGAGVDGVKGQGREKGGGSREGRGGLENSWVGSRDGRYHRLFWYLTISEFCSIFDTGLVCIRYKLPVMFRKK